MTRYAKGAPRVDWPMSALLKEAHLSIKSDVKVDTTGTSFALFRVPARTFIEGFRVQVNTAFTSTNMVQAPTLSLGDTPAGRQFGVLSAALQDANRANPLIMVGAEYDTPVTVYGTLKAAAITGEAEVWLVYRPSIDSPWGK